MSIIIIFSVLVPKIKNSSTFEQASANLIAISSLLHEAVNLPAKKEMNFF
jgi:hypothetical protein